MRLLTTLGLLAFTSLAVAGPQCTTADRAQWQDKDSFEKRLVDEGHKVKVFKITDGNCYELYGWNPAGQRVEIYFDPVSGKAVKTEIEE